MSGQEGEEAQFRKEELSWVPVEGRQEDTGRLTYGMLGTGLSTFIYVIFTSEGVRAVLCSTL